jgi:Dolichyl-phosphate-mannose-protein mannosyltransferase
MNSLLALFSFLIFVAVLIAAPADGGTAMMVALPIAALAAWVISRIDVDRKFLLQLFASAVMIRIVVGTLIYVFQMQTFFGGDAITYDYFGWALLKVWEGNKDYQIAIDIFSGGGASSGWGMIYLVAAIYKIVGRNMLAIQFVNSVIGAAIGPLAYLISMEIFSNRRVARICALLSAFFPSLVLWSSQGLKDGPIVFLLVLSMLATLKLGSHFSFKYLSALAVALCCLITLRFYVFYIAVLSIIVAFILGRGRLTAQTFARQMGVMILIGVALAYFGVSRYATKQFDTYGNLKQLQLMRTDASNSANSGFGQDLDVSSPEGALSALPLGLSYLILAPFPWQLASVRQAITLPEMLIWWTSLPLLFLGLWFALKYRLKEVAPIVIFTTLLTLTYSILQGNVGTAYRQRAQLLVFYFVFVAIGFVLGKEKREERLRQRKDMLEANSARPGWSSERKDQVPPRDKAILTN